MHTVHAKTLGEWLDEWDVRGGKASDEAHELWHAAPGGVRSSTAFSQSERWRDLDLDAANGCIRDVANAYSKDGGLAVLRGNIAVDGAVVKTAGVDESIWTFSGPAVVCESQDEAVEKIPVSYTHLDVYKRQRVASKGSTTRLSATVAPSFSL